MGNKTHNDPAIFGLPAIRPGRPNGLLCGQSGGSDLQSGVGRREQAMESNAALGCSQGYKECSQLLSL